MSKPKRIMTETEARDCVKSIKKAVLGASEMLLRLYEEEGWKALGYESWRECAEKEFEYSKTHLYRLLDNAKMARQISPRGEKLAVLTHKQKRVLECSDDPKKLWEETKKRTGKDNPSSADLSETLNAMPPVPPTQQEPKPTVEPTQIVTRGLRRLNVQKLLDGVTDSICKVEAHFPDEIELLIADLETHLERLRATRAANVLPLQANG